MMLCPCEAGQEPGNTDKSTQYSPVATRDRRERGGQRREKADVYHEYQRSFNMAPKVEMALTEGGTWHKTYSNVHVFVLFYLYYRFFCFFCVQILRPTILRPILHSFFADSFIGRLAWIKMFDIGAGPTLVA